jgi:exosortase/archaeosortase family protein
MGPKPPKDKSASEAAPDAPRGRRTPRPAWLLDQRPVLRFLLVFGLLMTLFYAVFLLPPDRYPRVGHLFDVYLQNYARVAGGVLRILGHQITVKGDMILSPEYTVRVVRGCDAIEATALFITAVLASPVPLRSKFPGILGGGLLLALINLARIVSLFYIGIHFPAWFETVHFLVWQPVFILLAVCLWLLWAAWARKKVSG